MSDAYKCDECGKLVEGDLPETYYCNIPDSLIENIPEGRRYFLELKIKYLDKEEVRAAELCDGCQKYLLSVAEFSIHRKKEKPKVKIRKREHDFVIQTIEPGLNENGGDIICEIPFTNCTEEMAKKDAENIAMLFTRNWDFYYEGKEK